MSQVQLLAHLPRFRMQPEQVAFPLGTLVKLTWDSYNSVTARAFEDWAPAYEAADPVFLLVEGEADLPFVKPGSVPGTRLAEMKYPSDQWYGLVPRVLGSPFLTDFHDQIVDVVWAALMLAVPGASPGWPRMSATMLFPGEGECVELGGDLHTGIRVQGEVDQEYVYSADTACRPITETDLDRAAGLVPVVQSIREDERLLPCLRQLLSTTDPALSPGERLVLAVSALEGLLLAEVRGGQQDAFAGRVVALLGDAFEGPARELYRARSRAVHTGPDTVSLDTAPGLAEQLVADVLIASAGASPPGDLALRGSSPVERLLPRPVWSTATWTEGIDLSGPEGSTVSWSPLVGLTYDGEPVETPCGATLRPMSAPAIVSMEEKDIRRDFIAKLQVERVSVAALSVEAPTGSRLTLDDDLMAGLLRPRDLTVAGLRIAGVHDFTDPELVGWYAYQGNLRHRRETVLRQTVLMRLGRDDHRALTSDTLDEVWPVWEALTAYNAHGAVPEVDRLLDLFRRAHDTFTNAETRATMFFALLEALLGRFRPAKDPVQLEDLVRALGHADPVGVAWMVAEGRQTRNGSAHGTWEPAEDAAELSHLRAICGAALRELLEVWPSRSGADDVPTHALVSHLTSRL